MATRPSSSSSSRGRSSSPFGYRKPPSPSYSSSSSSSVFANGRLIPHSLPSSVSSHFYGSAMPRSSTPNRGRSDLARNRAPVPFLPAEELVIEPPDVAAAAAGGGGDSISVTVRFRPLSEREFQRGFTPTQVLGMVLSDLKGIAEKNLNAAVVDCCIGIPLYFTDLQRRAVMDAAKIAGSEV